VTGSYYGRPVVKEPVWKPEVPWYFFAGGLGGASATLAYAARVSGNRRLARGAWIAAVAGVGASPPLLIADLGRPERFLNMLRVFKVTSPMSVGSWLLSATGPAVGLAAARDVLGRFPRAGRAAGPVAALLGLPLATYTSVLVSNSAIPAWAEARRELPFVFAGGAAASAGAAATLLTPPRYAGPARRLTVGGVVVEGAAARLMERRLGELARPYGEGAAGRYRRAAQALTSAGAVLVGTAGRHRAARFAGGGMVLAGALCERWMVFKAGIQSARDPRYTVEPQRGRQSRADAAAMRPNTSAAARPLE
jgi:hypothetical protein